MIGGEHVLENVQAGAAFTYPTKSLAIATYDAASVTATASAAWTFNAVSCIISHIIVVEGTLSGLLNFRNAQTGAGAFLAIFIDPALFTLPHVIDFGPTGLKTRKGFGIRAVGADTIVQVYYNAIWKNPL